MRTLGKVALGLLLLIGGVVALYKITFPTYTYRYRMTVEVMVDGVLHSGSSVIEVRLSRQSQFLVPVPPVIAKVRGEAVFVDLGKGRNVVALLASGPNGSNVDYPSYIVSQHFHLSTVDRRDLAKYSGLRGSWDLPEDQLPTLATFSDLNDPKTARLVAPNDFEQAFGPDVHFKHIRVEMTEAPVKFDLEARMPWWASSRRPAVTALRAAHLSTGSSIDAESAFVRR